MTYDRIKKPNLIMFIY